MPVEHAFDAQDAPGTAPGEGDDVNTTIVSSGTGTAPTSIIGTLALVPLTCLGLTNALFSWAAGDTQPAIAFNVYDTGAAAIVNAGISGVAGVTCYVDFIIPGQQVPYDTLTATSTDGLTWKAPRQPSDLITTTSGKFVILVKFVYADETQFSAPDSGSSAYVIVNDGY